MFERYTESARRALFFARYEASQLGSAVIDTEHVLLGVLHTPKGVAAAILERADCSLGTLRKDIESRVVFREKVATSVEIPFSPDTKRVLQYAVQEADRLGHNYIGTEHLLLGLLREEKAVAGAVLTAHGVRLADGRQTLREALAHRGGSYETSSGGLSSQIESIKALVGELAGLPAGSPAARALTDRILEALDALKRLST